MNDFVKLNNGVRLSLTEFNSVQQGFLDIKIKTDKAYKRGLCSVVDNAKFVGTLDAAIKLERKQAKNEFFKAKRSAQLAAKKKVTN